MRREANERNQKTITVKLSKPTVFIIFNVWIYTKKDVLFTLVLLLSAAAKAVVGIWVWEPSDVGDKPWHLAPSVSRVITAIVEERTNIFPVLSGFSCFSMNGNLCVTVAVLRLGTKLSAGFLICPVACKDNVFTAPSSPWTRASSASSSGGHVKRLPAQVVQRVLVIACHKAVLG